MADLSADVAEVNARVVYWGLEGAGKTANLRGVYGKLRPDSRGEIRETPTRFDPSVTYEVLPIELGAISGIRTRIQIVAVPSGEEQAPTRKQLLDCVDGIVFVADSQPDRLDQNVACFEELRNALAAYGRRIEDLPLVIQYNKRDLADPYALESLHRKLGVGDASVFEAVASESKGVLETLSTISKRVIRSLRDQGLDDSGAAPSAPPARPAATPAQRMEEAILSEDLSDGPDLGGAADDLESHFEAPAWEQVAGEIERPTGVRLGPDLSIVSVGEAVRVAERKVRVPLVLGDASGQTTSVALTVEIDPLVDELP